MLQLGFIIAVFQLPQLLEFAQFFFDSRRQRLVQHRNSLKVRFCILRIPGSYVSFGSPEQGFHVILNIGLNQNWISSA